MEGLLRDAARPGQHKQVHQATVATILRMTLEERPRDATHWSTRTLGERCGVSHMTVHRVWKAYDLQPHRVERFQLPTDPDFVAGVRDILGLYVKPPDQALVLAVDEKSQIQALERTQPILPLRPGIPERQTRDYQRHGTTTLLAALNVLTGKVIATCLPRHRHTEFLAFLEKIQRETPKGVGRASDPRQLRHAPTPIPGSSSGWRPIPATTSTSPPRARVGSTRWSASLPSRRASASGEVALAACGSWNGPSASMWPGTTRMPVLLCGPPQLPISSAKSVNKTYGALATGTARPTYPKLHHTQLTLRDFGYAVLTEPAASSKDAEPPLLMPKSRTTRPYKHSAAKPPWLAGKAGPGSVGLALAKTLPTSSTAP